MKRIGTIFKKEMRRYFTDPRMLVALFLPGILMFVLYSIIGTIIESAVSGMDSVDYAYNISYSDNSGLETPQLILAFDAFLDNQEAKNEPTYQTYAVDELEGEIEKLKDGQLDIVIAFSDNFETERLSGTSIPNVDIYYDASVQKSEVAYSVFSQLLSIYNGYTVNANVDDPNVGGDSFTMSSIVSFVFPMVVVSLLYSSTLSICPEAIAGEKERGTMALMLVTPVHPSELAIGKILSLSLVAICSGVVSAIGTIASLPKMVGAMSFDLTGAGFAGIFFSLVAILVFFVSLGSLISTFAKSTKEATNYMGPFIGLFIMLTLVPMLADLTAFGYSFIPIMNIMVCMSSVFSTPVSIWYWLVSIVETLLISGVFIFFSVRLFRSEKAMFS